MEELIAYKDMKNHCWWEKLDSGLECKPFGHYVFTIINTCAAVTQGKETFVENEYFYQSHIKSTPYNIAMGWHDENGVVSRDKMVDYYDEYIAGNKNIEAYRPEFLLLCDYIKNIDGFRNGKNAFEALLSIYNHFKYFATCICSDIYSYRSAGKERNNFFDRIYDDLLIYKGPGILDDGTQIEEYHFFEAFNIFILDFWEFLFNPVYKNAKLVFCANCGSMFVSSNNKAKYCTVCRQPDVMGKIRYANRKANKARKLHHDIATMAYSLNTKDNDISNSFLNESNYYWDIVQGKKPEKIQEYSAKIKTEADYIKWLEKKYKEIKAQK